MRIIGGMLRSRRFRVLHQDNVRPTMDAVREAVFSSLGGSCEGLKTADLFAGSGALGLEAWSRGAASVTFVEQHAKIWETLQRNIQSLENGRLGKIWNLKDDVFDWLSRAQERFNLILADPPYNMPHAMARTLEGIARYSLLIDGGRVVYEMRSEGGEVIPADWRVLRDKHRGKTRVLILMQKNEAIP